MAQKDEINLSKEVQQEVSYLLQNYMQNQFDIEISGLQSSLLTNYITENLGKYYYNCGVQDSIQTLHDKVDDLFLLMKDE